MAAGQYNITVLQGETFSLPLTWKSGGVVTDVTGYSARMQVRSSVTSATVLLELTSAAGEITIGTTDGLIQLDMTAVETAALTFVDAVYDLEIIPPAGNVRRILEGTFTVSREVTR